MNIDVNDCVSSLVVMLHAIGAEFKRPVNGILKRHMVQGCLILKRLRNKCLRRHRQYRSEDNQKLYLQSKKYFKILCD